MKDYKEAARKYPNNYKFGAKMRKFIVEGVYDDLIGIAVAFREVSQKYPNDYKFGEKIRAIIKNEHLIAELIRLGFR